MENTKSKKIIEDIRQSENWAKYLKSLGWESHRTKTGINVELISSFFGTIAKIQRPSKLSAEDLKEIDTMCSKCLFIKLEPGLDQNIETLEKAGYTKSSNPLSPPTTILINLKKDEKTLWEALSRSGHRSIKKAQEQGVNIKFYQNPSNQKAGEFYKTLKATGKKKGFYVAKMSDLTGKIAIFKEDAVIAEAKTNEGKLAGAYLCLTYKDTAWFMHGCTTNIGRKGNEGHALMWETILYFKKQGCHILDLEGKDDDRFPSFTKNWGGFSYFKEKFGGEVIEYPYPYIKYLHPLLKKLSPPL